MLTVCEATSPASKTTTSPAKIRASKAVHSRRPSWATEVRSRITSELPNRMSSSTADAAMISAAANSGALTASTRLVVIGQTPFSSPLAGDRRLEPTHAVSAPEMPPIGASQVLK
jgi:hypothetical protein